jgi:polyisoprenyl-phosphate glycosyltransferase
MMLSILVPVYKEEASIPGFLERLRAVLSGLSIDYEVIFCMDPSPDRTEEVILEQRIRDPRVKLLGFSRRFGQPMATLAGLQYAGGDAVIVMDVDLQDPPELITEMLAKWREGYDVVMPQRRSRTGEPWTKKLIAWAGYAVINKITDVRIPRNTGDFRLMSRRVVNEVLKLKECHGFLRGMVALVGFRQVLIPFDRPPRQVGQTHYNAFIGSVRIGFNGLFCFSTSALTLATKAGFTIAGASFLLMAAYLLGKAIGWALPWGNPTLVMLISFLGGVQLISVGILGEYIGRIYEEVRQRPRFIVARQDGFGPGSDSRP